MQRREVKHEGMTDIHSRETTNSSKLMKDRVDVEDHLSYKPHSPQGQTVPC